MPSIKLHVFRFEMGDHGTENCDFRGSGELGAGANDQHRTVLEDDPADDFAIQRVVEMGPGFNQMLNELCAKQPDGVQHLASALGLEGSGPVGLRLGVWDQ